MEKTLYDYKLGEEVEEENMKDFDLPQFFKKPIKCVRIAYTFQDKNGTQMEVALNHNDYIDHNEDDSDEEE